MNLQPHIDTLRALLAGRHPENGADLTSNPLDDASILRRLTRTLQALEQVQLENGFKGSTTRRRAPWTTIEDEQLKSDFRVHGTECFPRLALSFERTPRSVAERAVFLGLIKSRAQVVTPEERGNSLFASQAGAAGVN